MNRDNISSPIEQGRTDGVGEPWAIARHGRPLNDRQQALLDRLPEYDSRVTVDKGDVSMVDLAALTAKTGDEFALFTRGSERLIVRGDSAHIGIDSDKAALMNAQGFKWSGHTHAGCQRIHLIQSLGDVAVLRKFNQPISVIYNSVGEHKTFGKT